MLTPLLINNSTVLTWLPRTARNRQLWPLSSVQQGSHYNNDDDNNDDKWW
jgi:hypothetical protein